MLNDTFPLRVEAIPAAHASEWRADDSFPPSETQAWQLVFVRSGTIEERCDARHVLLRAGGLLFHQPGEVFAMTTVGEVPPETLRIDFYCTGAAMDRFRGAMLHTEPAEQHDLNWLANAANELFDAAPVPGGRPVLKEELPFGAMQQFIIHLENLLILLARRCRRTKRPVARVRRERRQNALVEDARAYFAENLAHELKIDDICTALGCTRPQLQQAFRARLHRTAMEEFSAMRIEYAAQLLARGASPGEVAAQMGYCSGAYFSQKFRAATGHTPSAYRRIQQGLPARRQNRQQKGKSESSGGAGYIGSHTCVELLAAGYDIVVADNYYNSCPEALARVKKIAGKDFRFVEADMTDKDAVEKIFAENEDIDCVIQFAAYKAVGESVSKPIEYYSNNLACTLNILDVMRRHNCHNIIFSSSATVYGDPASVPIREDFPVGGTTNPYGTTKVFTERILTDCCHADPELNVALLRYFNPIGAHPSGLIGEDPNGIPNNLVPYIAKVAVGKLEKVHVFGNDYPTPDGTGVRDYIHVVDLARGHVAAIKKLEQKPGLFICNLGTGHGYSVLDVINAFSKACGKEIPYVIDPRRPGDIAECWCDPSKAKRELGWEAQYGIEEMCAHSWNWQSHNPDGYKTAE